MVSGASVEFVHALPSEKPDWQGRSESSVPERHASESGSDATGRRRQAPRGQANVRSRHAGTNLAEVALEVPSLLLFALDGLEQCLEVALSEAAGAVALNDLEEDGGPVADRLREDLEQVALVVAVDLDAEPAQVVDLLVDLADPLWHVVVVLLRDVQELDAAFAQLGHAAHDVARGHRDVLSARAVVVLDVLLDLRLALALGRLVDRELDLAAAVGDDLR